MENWLTRNIANYGQSGIEYQSITFKMVKYSPVCRESCWNSSHYCKTQIIIIIRPKKKTRDWSVCIRNLILRTVYTRCFVSAVLPSPQLWHDRVISVDDMEGTDGGHRKWEPHCGCAQVGTHQGFQIDLLEYQLCLMTDFTLLSVYNLLLIASGNKFLITFFFLWSWHGLIVCYREQWSLESTPKQHIYHCINHGI